MDQQKCLDYWLDCRNNLNGEPVVLNFELKLPRKPEAGSPAGHQEELRASDSPVSYVTTPSGRNAICTRWKSLSLEQSIDVIAANFKSDG